MNAFLLALLGVFGMGFREAWYDWRMRAFPPNRCRLWQLTINFFTAFLISLIVLVALSVIGVESNPLRSVFQPSQRNTLILMVLCTCIAWPAAFLALLTPLRAARANFIDWGAVPIFGVIIGVLADPSSVFGGNRATVVARLGSVCIAGLGALIVVRASRNPTIDNDPWWPPKTTYKYARILGVIMALAASFFGLLGFHYLGELQKAGASAFALMPIRIAPLCFILGIASYLRKNRDFSIQWNSVKISFWFGLLLLGPLFVLVISKKSISTATFSMLLLLIPLSAFFFSFRPFPLRKIQDVPSGEWMGILLILAGSLTWILVG